jgi:Protein of unknown function (DUF3349)
MAAPPETLAGDYHVAFQSILNWLRAGYPEGVPGPDRVPLLALLRSTPLTDDEI